jgi:xanthine dehydrogenase YagS FAD-binding subunit
VEGDNRYYHAILEGGPCHIVHPSDLAPALIALDASVEILGAEGTRTLPLESFFVTTAQDLYRENVLGDQQLITRVRMPPPPPGSRQVFVKATVRQGDEFALASAALVVRARTGICDHARIVLGDVSHRPYRARAAESAILGREITAAAIRTAADRAVEKARPMSGNAYKVNLARNLLRRALDEAMETPPSQPSQPSGPG